MRIFPPKLQADFDVLKKEVVIETYRSSGPGGQRKNKTETSVRVKHIPTGITAVATEHRFQSQNLRLALKRLRDRLLRLNQKKRPRIPTGIPARAVEKRMEGKKYQSIHKRLRQKVRADRLPEE